MRRKIVLFGSFGFGICAGCYVLLVWIAAGWLVMPPRKPLDARHREWLAGIREHGMRLERGVTADGAPYLMCEPDAACGPGKRGRIIRDQLAAKGMRLGAFGEIEGTLVIFHGRGGRKEDFLLTAERFCAAGLRCLLPDLPAHGENPARMLRFGLCADERVFARSVLESAAETFGFSPRPAGLWGISLGGAYAVHGAAEKPERWSAMVVVSSFDELLPVVELKSGEILGPLAPLANAGFDGAVWCRTGYALRDVRPVERATEVRLPVMIVHGTADELIVIEHGRRIYDALPAPSKRWVEVRGGLHGNVLTTPMPLFAEMAAWYLRWLRAAESGR